MKLKALWDDFKAIIYYFITEPFIQIGGEIKSIWEELTNKKIWFYAWTVVFIISAFLKLRELMIVSLVMAISFFVIYHIQTGRWKERKRQRSYEEKGLKKFKKKR